MNSLVRNGLVALALSLFGASSAHALCSGPVPGGCTLLTSPQLTDTLLAGQTATGITGKVSIGQIINLVPSAPAIPTSSLLGGSAGSYVPISLGPSLALSAGALSVTGAFTTLSASGTVSGSGFTNLFASPPPIGATTPNTVTSTTLTATGSITGTGTVGAYSYGALPYSDTGNFGVMVGTSNSYLQWTLLNLSTGATASVDYVVGNSTTTATTNYGDFGMNGSGFTGSGAFNQPGSVYLTSTSQELAIGTTTANGIHFVINGATTDAMAISSVGAISGSGFTSLFASPPAIGGTTPGAVTATTLNLKGGTSGVVTIQPQATAGTYNFNVPIAAGTAGQPLISQGGGSAAMTWGAYANLQTAAAAPAGTTNTTGVMMGLAGSITPGVSGKIRVTINGIIFNATTIADGAQVQIRYGTGGAPSNAAALTGTAIGSIQNFVASTVAEKVPFSLSVIITGLTVNTAVWLDVSLAALTAGTAQITQVTIAADEMP